MRPLGAQRKLQPHDHCAHASACMDVHLHMHVCACAQSSLHDAEQAQGSSNLPRGCTDGCRAPWTDWDGSDLALDSVWAPLHSVHSAFNDNSWCAKHLWTADSCMQPLCLKRAASHGDPHILPFGKSCTNVPINAGGLATCQLTECLQTRFMAVQHLLCPEALFDSYKLHGRSTAGMRWKRVPTPAKLLKWYHCATEVLQEATWSIQTPARSCQHA